MMEKPYCTRKEVCQMLGIDKDRYYELVKVGLLEPRKFPTWMRKRYVPREQVLKLAQELAA